MKTRNLVAVVVATLASIWTPARSEWTKADPNFKWSFPNDHWAHRNYQTEWWYFTGHLTSKETPPREYGYQFTFFRIGVVDPQTSTKETNPSKWATTGLVMGHAAITDIQTQRHLFSQVLFRESPLLGQFNNAPMNPIVWSQPPAGTEHRWELSWNGRAFDFQMEDRHQQTAFQLTTQPLKPLIFQGPNGYSQKNKSADAASYYYSFTRLATSGTLTVGGKVFSVTGKSWMDKEFSSNQLSKDQKGLDWFSLQLNDGRDVMLYVLRGSDNKMDFGRGTVIPSHPQNANDVRYLSSEEWKITADSEWTSPQSGARYPSEWRVEIASEQLQLRVRPRVQDQENRGDGPGLPYWEGAVDITDESGNALGKGYVELTGWGK